MKLTIRVNQMFNGMAAWILYLSFSIFILCSCTKSDITEPDIADNNWNKQSSALLEGVSSSSSTNDERLSNTSSANVLVSSSNQAPSLSTNSSSSNSITSSSTSLLSSSSPVHSLSSSSFSASSIISSSSALLSSSSAVKENLQTCIYVVNATTTPVTGTLKCIEKTYKTVVIGTQVWMAENLNVGETIITSVSANQANNDLIEKYCYANDVTACATSGGLYQWAEAMGFPAICNTVSISNPTCNKSFNPVNHQGICPSGWHIPKTVDLNALTAALSSTYALVGATMKMKTNTYSSWDDAVTNDGNSSGFSGYPVGGFSNNAFAGLGSFVGYWDAVESNPSGSSYHYLASGYANFRQDVQSKVFASSIRCVKD